MALIKEQTAQYLQEMGVNRYQIFVSLSSKDKDKALELLSMMDSRNLNYWCMYHSNGAHQNIIGNDYKSIIAENIAKSCIFVFLFSKASISSDEVREELEQVAHAKKQGHLIRFLPISLDDIQSNELPTWIRETKLFPKGLVFRQLDDHDPNSYSLIMTEIRTQYYDTITEIMYRHNQTMKKASAFTDLLCDCIHRKCYARSVSQDIKAGDEGSRESLMETHILTDEIAEYDEHPYSCMLISSNLLGNIDPQTNNYNPKLKGVKYFYYCSKAYLDEVGEAFRQKMREYLTKSRISRGEVVLLIRREFAERNRILDFVDTFNRLTKDNLLDKYNITDPEDERVFLEEMAKDENDYYFSYTELPEDCLRVPDAFYTWMSKDHDQLYNRSIRTEAYAFIAFLDRLATSIENVRSESPARVELLKRLKKFNRYLDQLMVFERWQMGDSDVNLTNVKAKKLSNHLIGFVEGSASYNEEFKNLSDWMRFNYDDNGNIVEIDESIIEAALNNLIYIPIPENSPVKPCYSFVVFVNKHFRHASWYSTGYESHNNNMVISYEANPETGECNAFVDAFKALIYSDPMIEETLKEHNSKLIQKRSNS